MRKILVTLLLSVMCMLPVSAMNDWTTVANQTLKSIVYIETEEGTCTGFVINEAKRYVLTANHCDNPKGKVWLDRVEGKIVSKDVKKDLAVYEVKELDESRPALKLATTEPEIGQEVLSAGFGMGLERPLVRKAMISDTALNIPSDGIGGPFIALDAALVGGQSGGPVVNSNGEVVMIVQQTSDKVGIGVSAKIIKDRVGRFFQK